MQSCSKIKEQINKIKKSLKIPLLLNIKWIFKKNMG